MTKDGILALEPGPELNVAVGKVVMNLSKWDRYDFLPSTNWTAAGHVVKKMNEEGYWLELNSPFYEGVPWFAGFTPHHTTGWNGIPDNNAPGQDAPEAICKAALLAKLEAE